MLLTTGTAPSKWEAVFHTYPHSKNIRFCSSHFTSSKINSTLNKVPGNSVVLPPTAILTPSGPTAIKVKSSYWIFQDTIGTSFDLNSQEYYDNPHYCVNRVTTGYKSGRHLWLTALK